MERFVCTLFSKKQTLAQVGVVHSVQKLCILQNQSNT